MRPRPARRTLLAAIALTLGACAGQGGSGTDVACPATQVAVPSDRIGHSDEEGRIRYVATIEDLVSRCRAEGDRIALDLAFNVRAERGPVFEDEPLTLTYYIATVDPGREIVDKELLAIELTLQPWQSENVIREELTLMLPIAEDATGGNYNLYVGFQPDREF
jgi:hypothetical protein